MSRRSHREADDLSVAIARQYVQEGRVPGDGRQIELDPVTVADDADGQAFNAEALLT